MNGGAVGLAELHLMGTLAMGAGDGQALCSLSEMLRKLGAVVAFSSAAVYLREPRSGRTVCEASCGLDLDEVKSSESQVARTAGRWNADRRAPALFTAEGRSILMAPIRTSAGLAGVLRLEAPPSASFGTRESQMAAIAAVQIGLILEARPRTSAPAAPPQAADRLFDKAGIPRFTLSSDGRFLRANAALTGFLGYSGASALDGVNFFSDVLDSSSDGGALRRLFGRVEFLNDLEARVRRRDGSRASVRISCLTVRDAAGRVVVHEGIWNEAGPPGPDETERLHSERMASLGRLAADVAHDFNNLIAGISGCASLMAATLDPESPHQEDLRTLLSAANKARDLAGQLLAYGRVRRKSVHRVSPNALASEVLDLLAYTLDPRVEIRRRLAPDACFVETDGTSLQQAVMNLCLNARDAMPLGGRLTVETKNVRVESRSAGNPYRVAPGEYVRIRVRDTGSGMNPDTLRRIFEPFFTTKEGGRGNGLGLSITLENVRRLGGGMSVTSRPGRGTCFDIVLPQRGRSAPCPGTGARAVRLPRGHETVLFVDDEDVIRRMGKRMLERFGYRVLVARDGQEALEIVRRAGSDIDLCVVDRIMPRMDGAETLRRLKQERPGIKALLTSGMAGADQEERSKREGFCGFLPKPFQIDQFLHAIRRNLDGPPLPA
jgi:signal transduction histidine kinase/ActR/RegA family two-component response regulator